MRRVTLYDNTLFDQGVPPKTVEVDFREDGVYEYVWPDGHKTITVCQTEHGEMLIERAVDAYLERNFRDVVVSAASGVDSYLNFHIEILLLTAGKTPTEVAALLALTDKQENRRWGAFLALELQFGRGALPVIKQKQVELRNSIVHGGKVPTPEQALGYLKAVCDFVAPLNKRLHAENYPAIKKRFFAKAMALPHPHPTIGNATMWTRTVIGHINHPAFFPDAPFDGTVEEYIREKNKAPGLGFRKPVREPQLQSS
jgi:hypothetical protein